jgi:hypothetical protein
LQLCHGASGLQAEYAIYPAGVEAERRQTTLQVRDVVSSEHGLPLVEKPIAELQSGFDQGSPRLRAEYAIYPETTCILESLYSSASARSVVAEPVGERVEAERRQTTLDVSHVLAVLAEDQMWGRLACEWMSQRYAWIS